MRAQTDRLDRGLGSHPIPRAFAISLMVHFLLVGGVELGRKAGLWQHSLLPNFTQSQAMKEVVEEAARHQQEIQKRLEETPEAEMVFMDVDPAQALPEPPKNAKYYSTVNTRAANPDPKENLEKSKIDGKQENVPKVMDTMRPDPGAAQPAPTPPAPTPKPEPPKPEPQPQPQRQKEPPPQQQQQPPRPAEEEKQERNPEGDMLLARAAPRPEPKPESPPPVEPPRPRLRTLQEARAQKGIIESPKMRQQGGARLAGVEGMDVKATPFGAYDAAFIAAVQARWFNLLDDRSYIGAEAGKVVVEFNLNYDGRITDLRVAETAVSETLSWLCQRAILDPAPYQPFPPDLRRMLHRNIRPVRFTFYYNQ